MTPTEETALEQSAYADFERATEYRTLAREAMETRGNWRGFNKLAEEHAAEGREKMRMAADSRIARLRDEFFRRAKAT